MGLKRFLKKMIMGGGNPVTGTLSDAFVKACKSGRPLADCMKESFKETITEDTPGLSHLYNAGKTDGEKIGTVEQACRDEEKMQKLKDDFNKDREEYEDIIDKQNELIDDMIDNENSEQK